MNEIFWRDLDQIHRKKIYFAYSLVALLGVICILSILGWQHSNRTMIVSIPPTIPYGYTVSVNQHHLAEIFTFAGYMWQQLHIWREDGAREGAHNIDKLAAFLSPKAKKYLHHQHQLRLGTDKLKNRTRTIQPVLSQWDIDNVKQINANQWQVQLKQLIVERYNGIIIKQGVWDFYLTVITSTQDPEKNPWQLMLDEPYQASYKHPDDSD